MPHPKSPAADHPIASLISARWSPYAFDPRPVEREKLLACLEAARWAASSFNEQPWHFIVAEREMEADFDRLLSCLMEANQAWAKDSGVLLLTAVCRSFTRNGKPNRMAEHDLGLAVGNLSLQATEFGLGVHQMAGINPSKARQLCQVPETHDPITAIAIGYVAAEHAFHDRDQQPRQRRALSEFCSQGVFGSPLPVS